MECPYCKGSGEVEPVDTKDSFRRKLRVIFCEHSGDAKFRIGQCAVEGDSVNWVTKVAVGTNWATHIHIVAPTEALRRYDNIDEVIFYYKPTAHDLFMAKGKVLPKGGVFVRDIESE